MNVNTSWGEVGVIVQTQRIDPDPTGDQRLCVIHGLRDHLENNYDGMDYTQSISGREPSPDSTLGWCRRGCPAECR